MFIALEVFVSQKSLSNVPILLAWSRASNYPISWLTYTCEARLPWCGCERQVLSTVHEPSWISSGQELGPAFVPRSCRRGLYSGCYASLHASPPKPKRSTM